MSRTRFDNFEMTFYYFYQATAILFAKAGCNVLLVARRAEALAAVKEACISAHKEGSSQFGGNFEAITLDISDRTAVNNIWSHIPTHLKDIDVLGPCSLNRLSLR